MRILVLGNCPVFVHAVFFHLTNDPSVTSTARSAIRFGEHRVVDFEMVVGMQIDDGVGVGVGDVWGLEAIQADGIIHVLDPNGPEYSPSSSSLDTFISAYNSSLLPTLSLPAVLLLPPSAASGHAAELTEMLGAGRCLEVDRWSGQNCHLALLSLIYLIAIKTETGSVQ